MGEFNGKKRSELPDSVFGIPQERKYPMPDEKHTRSAIKLFNHVDPKYEEQLAKAVIKNMKKYGIDGSVVGPNNRLRKYLPKDMIKESITIPAICSFEPWPILELKYKSIPGPGILSVIRPIPKKDKDYIQHIMNNLDGFKDFAFDKICFYHIEKNNQTPVGFVILRKKPELQTAFVSIGVDEKYRGHGIGSKLVEKAISYFKNTKDLMWLECWANINNEASIALAEKSGFIKYTSDNTNKSLGCYKYYMKNENGSYGQIKESYIEEGYLKSDKDIYYNKDKFDSGDINLCFITGLSGSGKSTMGRGMSSKNIEHYEIDDVICNDNFSDSNLKEYGGLIESFFKGSGKSFRLIRGDDNYNDHIFKSHKNYEKEITQAFVKHAISYCKSHKGTKYVCDGIWIFMFIKPEQLKDCAVYIKGTSSIKSGYRALKRDIDEDRRNGMTSLQIFKHEFKRVKEDVLYARENQKELKSFKSYFEKQSTNESVSILPQDTGISTIIFDIGDVLIRDNFNKFLKSDPEIPDDQVDTIKELWFLDKDNIDDTMDLDTYREIVNKRMGVEFSKYIPKLFKYNVDAVEILDYTIPMIQDLKDRGYKVYYLSNWSSWTHDLLQEAGKFNFLKLMDGGVFSYDVGYMKPDEEIYKILLNKYKINPEEAIFFDDKKENIVAAKKMGIHGIVFDNHDPSIVYNTLDNFYRLYTTVIAGSHISKNNRTYDYNSIFESIGEYKNESLIVKKIDEEKVAKEIVNIIKPIIMTNKNKSNASSIGLSLKCNVEEVDSGMVFVLILDGPQDKRDTDEARFMLKELASKCKSKLSDLVSKVDIGDGDEGCLYFTMNKNKIKRNRKDLIKESSITEYGTTGGTIVGTNQPDSVYIVNYMQNNVFSGHKEQKQAICKKGMNQMYTTKNGKSVPVDKNKFKEEASDVSVFKFKGSPFLSYDKIIESAIQDSDYYSLLTGDDISSPEYIKYDNRFIEEEPYTEYLDDITSCIESSIIGTQFSEEYPYMKVLTESVDGRCWNYYNDINGYFVMNELTGLRSPSYDSIEEIPESQIQVIERGTIYLGE